MMISIILGTDMKHHFGDIAKAKARLTAQDFNIKDKNDKLLCMNSVVHAADISNPIKEWSISFGWTQVVMEEFWNQVLYILYIIGRIRKKIKYTSLISL